MAVQQSNKPFLLTLEYPPQLGGVAKYLQGEVKASSVPVVVSHIHGKKWFSLIWRARRRFDRPPPNPLLGTGGGEYPCDYLWISHVLPIGYIALAWKCFYKTPYRVYLHGLDLVLPRSSKWKSFWVKIILQNADEIITNSQATAELLKFYGIDPSGRDAINRVSTIRVQYPRIEKINTEQYIPIAEKLREKFKIGNIPILLTVSRLVKRKGIDLVIKALPEVWRNIPDLVYVVVGEGDDKQRLTDIVARIAEPPPNPLLGKGGGVIFVGAVSDEEKYGWLAACDCFILTPIDDPHDFEGYGIVYKEAQMFNKPVIGSRVGGVAEAVGENGILVEAGNVEEISRKIQDTISKMQTRHNNQYSK